MARVFCCVAISLLLSACATEAPRTPVAAEQQAQAPVTATAQNQEAAERKDATEPPKSLLACTGLPLAGRKCGIPHI